MNLLNPRRRPPRRQLPEDASKLRRARRTHARPTRPRQTLQMRQAERAECVELDGFDSRKCRHPAAPRVRADCEGHGGPCVAVACKHTLALDVSATIMPGHTPRIRMTYGTDDPDQWPMCHCVLDAIDAYAYPSDRHIMLFREIGAHMKMTRQRVQQVYQEAEPKFVAGLIAEGFDAELVREWIEGKGVKRAVPEVQGAPIKRRSALERRREELAQRAQLLAAARARGRANGGGGAHHAPTEPVEAPVVQCAAPRIETVRFF